MTRAAVCIAAALASAVPAAGFGQPADLGAALPDALDAGWKGRKVCERLFENDRVRALRCTFPPGVGHERHVHRPHWGYIEQGSTMRITTAEGTSERVVRTGSNWWSDGSGWHEVVNVGVTTGIYVIVEPKAVR